MFSHFTIDLDYAIRQLSRQTAGTQSESVHRALAALIRIKDQLPWEMENERETERPPTGLD